MARQRPAPANETLEHPLSKQIERLCNELQLTRQVLDELRTDVQWAIQNGLVPRKAETPLHNLLPVYDEGDAVEVNHNRLQEFGEIISVDDAETSAVVLLIPSNETITLPQDSLSRVAPDSLRRACTAPALCVVPDSESADTSNLLSDPGDKGHLF
jgi:hypothetical protein